jgi:serine/threonine protein kinase
VKKSIFQLISVLEYLHDKKHVCHRDIKRTNILSDKNGNIRLIDFGLSRYYEQNMKTICGSTQYMAPEVLQGNPYSQQCDIWSVGILIYVMVTGEHPFNSNSKEQMIFDISNHPITLNPEKISPALLDLLQQILVKNPDQRLTISQIKKHHWFAQFP